MTHFITLTEATNSVKITAGHLYICHDSFTEQGIDLLCIVVQYKSHIMRFKYDFCKLAVTGVSLEYSPVLILYDKAFF